MTQNRSLLALVSLGGVAIALSAACGGDDVPDDRLSDAGVADATSDGTSSDGTVTTDAVADGKSDDADSTGDGAADAVADAAPVERGPKAISFAGDPNGLWWAYGANATLYIADEANDRIVEWTDATGLGRAYVMPTAEDGGAGLGQVVRKLDGTMYVTRFGFGFASTILTVDKTGDAGAFAYGDGGLSASRRRLGLALLPDDTLLDSYFTKSGSNPRVGTVARYTPPTTEKEFLSGLMKPVGVVWNENKIYVTDQDIGAVLRIGVAGGVFGDAGSGSGDGGGDGGGSGDAGASDAAPPARAEVFATIPSPDLLCVGPNGTLFVGSSNGNVYQVARNGTVSTFFTSPGGTQTRGCAYDGAHTRLFVAERGTSVDGGGASNVIRILPVN